MDSKAAAAKADRKFAISPALIVIFLALIAGVGAFIWLSNSPPPAAPPKPKLTQQARGYLSNLKLSDVQPQTSESYIQSSLFEIMGKITNDGPKIVRGVLVTCVFRGYDGHEIKREVVSVTNASSGPLTPHSTKPFRLAFDDIPDTWNHQMPDFVIAEIAFQ